MRFMFLNIFVVPKGRHVTFSPGGGVNTEYYVKNRSFAFVIHLGPWQLE